MRLKSGNPGDLFRLQPAEFTTISAAARFTVDIFTPTVVICPTAHFPNSCQASIEKYFSFPETRIRPMVRPVPHPTRRGGSRSSRTLGAGCDGRLGAADERGLRRTSKSVWS